MEFHVEPEAVKYITHKSPLRIIRIDLVERPGSGCSCSGGGQPRLVPSVKVGSPNALELYKQTIAEGITVYYRPNLERLFTKIIIKIEKLVVLKFLVADGQAIKE